MRPIAFGRDALRPGNVNESLVVMAMRCSSNPANRFQFLSRIEQAFIPAGNIVIDLDAVDAIVFGLLNDLLSIR
jgi:hypothetical protein